MLHGGYFTLCCLLLLGISGVPAEVQFLCPGPLVDANDTSQGPCGAGDRTASFSTEIQPGPLTISWRDTAIRPGSSYRVTLRNWAKPDEFCILQDRVPSASCSQQTEDAGNCSRSKVYYLTVNIPYISCEMCYLQITTIFPNGTDCLVSFDSRRSECPIFYSCANIVIRTEGQDSLRECEAEFYRNKKTWPFNTNNVRQNFSVDFRDFLDLFPYADGTFSLVPLSGGLRGRVTYHVDLWLATNTLLYESSIVWKTDPKLWARFRPLQMQEHGSYQGFMGVVSAPYDVLLRGGWHVEIKTKHEGYIGEDFNITRVPLITTAEVYSDVTGSYTAKGWLTGPEFDGPTSFLSRVITRVGFCIPGHPAPKTIPPPVITSRQAESTTVSVPAASRTGPPTTTTSSEPSMSSTGTAAGSPPVPTKPNPDADPKTTARNTKTRAERNRFLYIPSGSDSLSSSRAASILSGLASVVLLFKQAS